MVYETGKPFTFKGRRYERGEVVDTSGMDRFKIGQLLSQRYLSPQPPQPNNPAG